MSVQQLNSVHRQYVRQSNVFKSAWTFHQFLQNLQKVFVERPLPEQPADFQGLYSRLKTISKNLTETGAEAAGEELAEVEIELSQLIKSLRESDGEVSPSQLRQFFQRVKSYEDTILSQLVKFYLFSQNGSWSADRLDKVDFLTTKLCEEFDEHLDAFLPRDRTHLREVSEGFWSALGSPSAESSLIEQRLGQLIEMRRNAEKVKSIQDLDGTGLVLRYRQLKHELGDLYFQPSICPEIVETNLKLKNLVRKLYHHEEQRIVAEYQEIFELEREVPVDLKLDRELKDFRVAVERFEQQLEGSNVRLDSLVGLRRRMAALLPKLRPERDFDQGPVVQSPELRELLGSEAPVSPRPSTEFEYVAEHYRELVAVLEGTMPTLDARKVTVLPEVFPFRLEPREVIAYRRLFGDATCDRDLEELLLRAAALRLRVEQEVEAIRGLLDDSAITQQAPIFSQARRTVFLADLFVRRYEHLMHQVVLSGDITEAQRLQVLRIRLMRAFSGLWLLLHK